MKYVIYAALAAAVFAVSGCDDDASVASRNLSKAADMFEVNRRVVFYNGITGDYMLTIEGLCSIAPNADKLDVTCKVGEGQFKKHFLGLSDNVTYFVEHMNPTAASVNHYRVVFKPQTIIPDIDVRGSAAEVFKAGH